MKKYLVLILFVSSVAFIVILNNLAKPNSNSSNFVRIFPPHVILPLAKVDVGYNSYYLAGSYGDTIYLGNKTANYLMLKTDLALKDTQHINLKIEELANYRVKGLQLQVDWPNFYLTDGTVPIVFKGKIETKSCRPFIKEGNSFSYFQPVSESSFAMRDISSKTHENILVKLNTVKGGFTPDTNVLEKQIDGLFCTDGQLQYNKESAMLIYIYYYRNQYICLDTNLKVLFRGRTIDTISKAQIKVTTVSSDQVTHALAAPPLIVNRKFCTASDWLFVNSNLIANNENKSLFETANVIDVYSLKEKKYKFSFYLNTKRKKDLHDFKIYKDKLFIINDQWVEGFQLNSDYFSALQSPKH